MRQVQAEKEAAAKSGGGGLSGASEVLGFQFDRLLQRRFVTVLLLYCNITSITRLEALYVHFHQLYQVWESQIKGNRREKRLHLASSELLITP